MVKVNLGWTPAGIQMSQWWQQGGHPAKISPMHHKKSYLPWQGSPSPWTRESMTLNSDIKKFTNPFKCWFPTLFKILVQMKHMLIPVSTHCTSLMPRMKIYELSTLYSLLSVVHQPVAKSEHNIALHTHSRLYKIYHKNLRLELRLLLLQFIHDCNVFQPNAHHFCIFAVV